MQHGAYADICGNLEKIIIINGINNKYGIIFITVDQKKMFDDPSYIWRGIYRSNCIPVFLWGQDVLDKFQHISSSEMVWTVGRLEKLDALLFENVSRYINCIPTTIITDRIASLKNLTIRTPLPQIKSYPFVTECAIREI